MCCQIIWTPNYLDAKLFGRQMIFCQIILSLTYFVAKQASYYKLIILQPIFPSFLPNFIQELFYAWKTVAEILRTRNKSRFQKVVCWCFCFKRRKLNFISGEKTFVTTRFQAKQSNNALLVLYLTFIMSSVSSIRFCIELFNRMVQFNFFDLWFFGRHYDANLGCLIDTVYWLNGSDEIHDWGDGSFPPVITVHQKCWAS